MPKNNNKRKGAEPGDLVFPDTAFLNKVYSDSFNHRCSSYKRPFIVVGKHRNRPGMSVIVPLSSKFYYNYTKLKRRVDLGLELPDAPSIILVSNNAHRSQGYYNAALLMDQAIVIPDNMLKVYRRAHLDYNLDSPKSPIRPTVPLKDENYEVIMTRWEKAEAEWEQCEDRALLKSQVNINLIVSRGRDIIKKLYLKGRMETDLEATIGRAAAVLHPDMLDF